MTNDPSRYVSESALEALKKEWAKWPALFAEMDERIKREQEEPKHSRFYIPDNPPPSS